LVINSVNHFNTLTGLKFGEDDLREKKRAVKLDLFDGAKTYEARKDAL